ncbi:hypothetical protein [Aeromonas hydrophila]|uniref:hypothetical protein n=1 Tax=Aeromonas hydrophila TaxID=644 RepID=UPI002B46A258|nr:hypothetical protein [Aeromonas hydrophila]
MLLSKIIWTLPEQQQIDLLTFYADHLSVHTATDAQSLFKVFVKGKTLAQEDAMEDRMLLSDRVIDAYLNVIEKGIALCEEANVPLKSKQDQFGGGITLGWYEADLATIAGCQRLNANHAARIANLLRSMTAKMPLEEFEIFGASSQAASAPRSGMSISSPLPRPRKHPSYRMACIAFCANPAVDADTLRELIAPLMKHLELEQQIYASSMASKANGLLYAGSTCCTLVTAIMNTIFKHRSEQPEVLTLLEELGWHSTRFLNGFELQLPPFLSLCEKLSNVEDAIKETRQRELADVVNAQPDIASPQLLNAAYEQLGLNIQAAAPLRSPVKPNLIELDCDVLARCCAAVITDVSKRIMLINKGAMDDQLDYLVAYQQIRGNAVEMYLEMIDANLMSPSTLRGTIRELFRAADAVSGPNSLESECSMPSVIKEIIKRQIVDMDFVFECLDKRRLYRAIHQVLLENKGVSSADLEKFIDQCNELGKQVDNGDIELDAGKQNAKAFFLAQLFMTMQNAVPMLLTKEYYPALLSGGAPSPASLGKLLEYASSMYMIDEGDLELFAMGGMEAICQHAGKEFSMAMSEMPDLNEKLITLLLQQRMERTEAVALHHSKGRHI